MVNVVPWPGALSTRTDPEVGDQAANHGKAEARAVGFVVRKSSKARSSSSRVIPRPVSATTYADAAIPRAQPSRDRDLPAFGVEALDGVGDEVVEDAAEHDRVAERTWNMSANLFDRDVVATDAAPRSRAAMRVARPPRGDRHAASAARSCAPACRDTPRSTRAWRAVRRTRVGGRLGSCSCICARWRSTLRMGMSPFLMS